MPKPPRDPVVTDPHDALVQWTFSQREHAVGLLLASLPSELTRTFDWGSLHLERTSFVTRELRKCHSDLVFSVVAAGEPIVVYVLIEHQRKVEPLMALRMLVYMTRLWEQFHRDHPGAKALPAVVPMLLHHSATGWTAATAFQDLIAGDGAARSALERYIPRFEMRLIDLSPDRESALLEEALTTIGKLALELMKAAGDDAELGRALVRVTSLLDELLGSPDGRTALGVLMRYIAATHQNLKAEKLGELFEKAMGPRGKEAIVTFIDEIELRGEARGEARGKAKGKREGKREGKIEGKREALLELLAARFGRVPAHLQARVRGADEATVGRWTVRVLTAATAVEVLGDDAESKGGARAASTKRTRVANRRAATTSKRA